MTPLASVRSNVCTCPPSTPPPPPCSVSLVSVSIWLYSCVCVCVRVLLHRCCYCWCCCCYCYYCCYCCFSCPPACPTPPPPSGFPRPLPSPSVHPAPSTHAKPEGKNSDPLQSKAQVLRQTSEARVKDISVLLGESHVKRLSQHFCLRLYGPASNPHFFPLFLPYFCVGFISLALFCLRSHSL